jgi:beta-galactosidase/beta-glucuronidase
MQTLRSWSENADPGVRYFSGSATYAKHFKLSPQGRPSGARLVLDLGELDAVAEVRLNGRLVGTLWNPPFEVDITGAAKRGDNLLEVKVTNLWVNRLIGDAQPGATKKYTFTTMPTYQADAPLRTSGLLGPVRIETVSAR